MPRASWSWRGVLPIGVWGRNARAAGDLRGDTSRKGCLESAAWIGCRESSRRLPFSLQAPNQTPIKFLLHMKKSVWHLQVEVSCERQLSHGRERGDTPSCAGGHSRIKAFNFNHSRQSLGNGSLRVQAEAASSGPTDADVALFEMTVDEVWALHKADAILYGHNVGEEVVHVAENYTHSNSTRNGRFT